MHLSKFWFALFITFLSGQFIHAQEGYRPGYIIKNNGDTLTGLVYYSPDSRFTRECRFKRFELITATNYTPYELVAFGFKDGRHFKTNRLKGKARFDEVLAEEQNSTPPVRWFADRSIHTRNSRFKTGFQGGAEYVIPRLRGDVSRYFSETSLNNDFRLKAGYIAEFDLLKLHDWLFLGTGIFYFSENYYGYAEYVTQSQCRDELFMGYKALQFPVYLKFNLSGKKIRPFLKAGVFGSVLLDWYYEHFAERQFGQEIFTEWYTDYKLTNDRGYLTSIGIDLLWGHARVISLEVQYMQGNELMIYTGGNYGVPLDNKIKTHVFGLLISVNL